MNRLAKSASLLMLLLAYAASVLAQTPPQKESLRGISAVPVKISADKLVNMPTDLLRDFVVSRLKGAKIAVPADNKPVESEGYALLQVIVVATGENWSEGFLMVEIRLKQASYLKRNPVATYYADTWFNSVYICDEQNEPITIKKKVGEALDAFIKDYLSVNKK